MNWFITLLLMLYCNQSHSQDTALLFFKEQKVGLSPDKTSIKLDTQDSLHVEFILHISDNKFFYVKQRVSDTIAIESGQLVLRKLGGKRYLLREGFWILETEEQKVLFENISLLGVVDEVRVHTKPSSYGGFNRKKHSKSVRKNN